VPASETMPAHNPFHDQLLSDDESSWRRHILWQSAALAPNEAADLELNKAVQEVGDAPYHFADLLPPRLRWLFTAYCIAWSITTGAVAGFTSALGAGMVDSKVDAELQQQLLQAGLMFVMCALVCELALLLLTARWEMAARGEAVAWQIDRWLVLDLFSLSLTAFAWLASQQRPACAAILALRFALQPLRAARSASFNATCSVGVVGASMRTLRPAQQGGGMAFDTDLGFDNTNCVAFGLRLKLPVNSYKYTSEQAMQDSGFESGSCCSSSELKAERALEANQASDAGFDGNDPSFEFDDIDAGWVCISCGTLNIGEDKQDRRSCENCEASPTSSAGS